MIFNVTPLSLSPSMSLSDPVTRGKCVVPSKVSAIDFTAAACNHLQFYSKSHKSKILRTVIKSLLINRTLCC